MVKQAERDAILEFKAIVDRQSDEELRALVAEAERRTAANPNDDDARMVQMILLYKALERGLDV